MLPPIVGNVEWVVTKVSSVSSVGVGIVLFNAAVNYSENLIFDNIDPTTHISDVGEKTYMTLVDNAKMAQIAMQQFGCFFLDKKTMKDATKKLTDVFDITFGTAYVHLSTLAKYLFGEDQGRYLIEVSEKNYEKVIALAKDYSIYIEKLGVVGGTDLKINHLNKVSIAQLVEKNSEFFEKYTGE